MYVYKTCLESSEYLVDKELYVVVTETLSFHDVVKVGAHQVSHHVSKHNHTHTRQHSLLLQLSTSHTHTHVSIHYYYNSPHHRINCQLNDTSKHARTMKQDSHYYTSE